MSPIELCPLFLILEICKYVISSSFVCTQKLSVLRVFGRNFLVNSSIGPSCSSLLGKVVGELERCEFQERSQFYVSKFWAN